MTTIAQRLVLLRGETKQGDFAKQLEINPNTLRAYESGRSLPNQELLEKICVKFSVSPAWLLLGRGQMFDGDPAGAETAHEAHIKVLEHQLAEAKEEMLRVYRLAVQNLPALTPVAQEPRTTPYGSAPSAQQQLPESLSAPHNDTEK